MRQNKLPLPVFVWTGGKFGLLVSTVRFLFVNIYHQHLFGEQHPVVTGSRWSLSEGKDAQVASARKVLGPHCQHSASDPESHPPPSSCRTKSDLPHLFCWGASRCLLLNCQHNPPVPNHIYIYKKLFPVGAPLNNMCSTCVWVALLPGRKGEWACTASGWNQGQTCECQGNY